MDGWDYRVLELDPNLPLTDQLARTTIMTEPEKEDLLWNIEYAMGKKTTTTDDESQGSTVGIAETVALVHEAYCKKKGVLDNHRKEEKQRKESQKWIGQGKELLKKPEPKPAPPAPTKVYRHEYEALMRVVTEEGDEVANGIAAGVVTTVGAIAQQQEENDIISEEFAVVSEEVKREIISEQVDREEANTEPANNTLPANREETKSSHNTPMDVLNSKLPDIGEEMDEDMEEEDGNNAEPSTIFTDDSTMQKSLSVHSTCSVNSDLSNGSTKKSKRSSRRKSKLKSKSKRRSSKLSLGNESKDVLTTHRLLTEKDIVAASLIAQIENLQQQLAESKTKSNEVRSEIALAEELDSTKRLLAEKQVIISSLVTQVQSLEAKLTEKETSQESQSLEAINLQSQLRAKDKVIEAQSRVIDALKNSRSRASSVADASDVVSFHNTEQGQDVQVDRNAKVKKNTPASSKLTSSSGPEANDHVIAQLRSHLFLQSPSKVVPTVEFPSTRSGNGESKEDQISLEGKIVESFESGSQHVSKPDFSNEDSVHSGGQMDLGSGHLTNPYVPEQKSFHSSSRRESQSRHGPNPDVLEHESLHSTISHRESDSRHGTKPD
eukprot:scaffold24341_cov117-Cylindrotheca_fusiformis.AAC.1